MPTAIELGQGSDDLEAVVITGNRPPGSAGQNFDFFFQQLQQTSGGGLDAFVAPPLPEVIVETIKAPTPAPTPSKPIEIPLELPLLGLMATGAAAATALLLAPLVLLDRRYKELHPEPEPEPMPEVVITAPPSRVPPPAPVGFDMYGPPNWNDLLDWRLPGEGIRFTPIRLDQPDQRPSTRPGDAPRHADDPEDLPEVIVRGRPAPVPRPARPAFDLDTFPMPGLDVGARPGDGAQPMVPGPGWKPTPEFGRPLRIPGPELVPFLTVNPLPTPTQTPVRRPGDQLRPGDTLEPFKRPGDAPTPLEAFQPQRVKDDACTCAPEKEKKKKRKSRAVCYRGTYIEGSKSLHKTRKEKVPCR